MLTLIKRTLAAAVVIAAMAAPTAAFARAVMDEPGSPYPVAAAPPPAAPDTGHAAASASPSFQWGDAGVRAGGLLVLIGVGAGAGAAYRRRAHRTLLS
jgi:hypothetical protein